MTQLDKLTPEYIVSIIKQLTEEELIALIFEYGEQEAKNRTYWLGKEL